MKYNFLTLAVALVLSASALAYQPGGVGDPNTGFRDAETKTVVKVDSVTGYDDAVSRGHGLFYEDGAGGLAGLYQVSRKYSGTYNTALASKVQACIAARDVATGDLGGFPCVTGGYVDYALYDATIAITKGDYLCVSNLASALGRFVSCGSGVTSGFIALESKASGTGSNLKVKVQSR